MADVRWTDKLVTVVMTPVEAHMLYHFLPELDDVPLELEWLDMEGEPFKMEDAESFAESLVQQLEIATDQYMND